MARIASLLIFVTLTSACEFAPDDFSDPIDECVTCAGKADANLEMVDPYLAAAIVDVANTASRDELDHNVGLYAQAADNIVDLRPFETLAELDAVDYVGESTLDRLANYAKDNGFIGFCGDGVRQPIVEECDDTTACSVTCQTIHSLDITFGEVEVAGTLQPGERRSYIVSAQSGDAVVAQLRKTAGSTWRPSLEMFREGRRVDVSQPADGSNARLPSNVSDLSSGVELESGSYTLTIGNEADVAGPFLLSLSCVGGPCADMTMGRDADLDGVADARDNCAFTPNATQGDRDADGVGDACDLDAGLDRFPGHFGTRLESAIRAQYSPTLPRSHDEARRLLFEQVDAVADEVVCHFSGERAVPAGIDDMTAASLFAASALVLGRDLHNLRPMLEGVAEQRRTLPFGEVAVPDWAQGGASVGRNGAGVLVFEPPHAIKGDIARSLFHVSVVYGRSLSPDQYELLRDWHELDPPDARERQRHQAIVNVQGSRNVFVDQPGLVSRLGVVTPGAFRR